VRFNTVPLPCQGISEKWISGRFKPSCQ